MTGSSRGPSNAQIMVVGEAYGSHEEREGQPFMGPSGSMIEELLQSSGINPLHVRFTNLVNARPPANRIRAWVTDEGVPFGPLVDGLMSLKEEIEAVQPNLILALGNYPLHFLTGKGSWKKVTAPGQRPFHDYTGIGDYRGSILDGTTIAGGRKCIPTYHPAAILQQYPLKPIVRVDLARAASQRLYPEIRRPPKHIVLDPQGSERDDWLCWLQSPPNTPAPCDAGYPAASFLSGDIEYLSSRLFCMGATRHADVAVVLRTSTDGAVREIRDFLLSGIPLCFQNAMFDCSILEYFYSIPCLAHLQHDTMIGMHVAYTEFPKDLGFIASIFTEQPAWKDMVDWKKIKKGEQSIDDVLAYNAIDTWVTHDSMEKMLADELQEPALAQEYAYEMSLVKPLWEVSKRGVLVNIPAMQTLATTLDEEIQTLTGGLIQLNNGQPLNPGSGVQKAQLLYDTLGVPRKGPKTPTGKWKMDDSTLAILLPLCTNPLQTAAVKILRKVSERLALKSKFCDIDLDDDGRMRCHYDPAKTDTSRLSSRKFYPTGRGANLQNIPKDSRCRAVFIADPGMFFGYADLKSAESLVVAHISGDVEMLRLHSPEYLAGASDGHKYVASFLLGKPIDLITKDERYLGKRVRHAGNYTMGWKKLLTLINTDAETTGVSITAAQAKVFVDKYRQLHPALKSWWDSVQADLWSTHTIYTCHGRKRVFYDRPDAILSEAVAYNPQGTVARTLNMGLLKAMADSRLADLGFEVLLQVHDAIGFQAPIANRDAVCTRLIEMMQVEIPIKRRGVEPYSIVIPVEMQVGANWGEANESNPNGLKTWCAA